MLKYAESCQPYSLLDDVGHPLLQPRPVFQRGDGSGGGGHRDVVRLLDLPEVGHDLGGEGPVADPQPGQPGPLAEGTQDDQIVVDRCPMDAATFGPGKLDVSLVEDDDEGQGQQPLQVTVGQPTAVGVVGRGDEEEFGAVLTDGLLHGVQVKRKIGPAWHRDHPRARDSGVKSVHPEGRGAVEHGVAGLQEEAHCQVNQFVGSGAGQDQVGG